MPKDISDDSSVQLFVKQQELNRSVASVQDRRGEISNEEYNNAMAEAQAQQMALDKQYEMIRERPLQVAMSQDPQLKTFQMDAIHPS